MSRDHRRSALAAGGARRDPGSITPSCGRPDLLLSSPSRDAHRSARPRPLTPRAHWL